MSNKTAEALVASLVSAVLDAEDPKQVLQRLAARKRAEHGLKVVADFHLEYCGIEHNQFWTGRGTAYTEWDTVYVGVGDTPHEAGEDALGQAGMDSWLVANIENTLAAAPSVADEFPDDEECAMQCYAVLWLNQKVETSPAEKMVEHLLEVESPKDFFLKIKNTPPSTWPEIDRWQSSKHAWDKSKFRRAWVQQTRHTWNSQTRTSTPYSHDYMLRKTRFEHDPVRGTHTVRLYDTDIMVWDRKGTLRVPIGQWRTSVTRDRLNHFLPYGWRVTTYKNNWYWTNINWPENIRDRLGSDVRARREPTFPWWVTFSGNDSINRHGQLTFAKDFGWARPDGTLKVPQDPNVILPPKGDCSPPGRRRPVPNDPRQSLIKFEGRSYLNQLGWVLRVRAKHEIMRDVERERRELANLEKPDKRKKKDPRGLRGCTVTH